jgi:HK97 family phage prohead protease
MGGWKEVIEPGALHAANLDELVARVDHAGVPIGRFPKTLDLEERSDGLHWSLTPPRSRADLLEAIQRGDLQAGSWQMVVSQDRWEGDTRHVEAISELRDVSVVSTPAYPAASVEYRAAPTKEDDMSEESTSPVPAEEASAEDAKTEERKAPENASNATDVKVTHEPAPALQVEDRASAPTGLFQRFESRGFPNEAASVSWDEYRSLTFGGTIDTMSPLRRDPVMLGADQRYAFPVFQSIAVGPEVTSVQILRQDCRTLAAGTAVVRAVDATSTKPEVTTAGTVTTLTMSQVAAKESSIPNLYLQQSGFQPLVEQDLRLSINEGYDRLVNVGISTAGTAAGVTGDILAKARKAITVVHAAGYQPNALIIDPAGAEAIDLFQSSGTEAFYQFGPGRFAPGQLFGLEVRVSKTAGTAVVDTNAFGKLYASPLTLARFEENAGATNTSTVRLEGNAAFGVERTSAAVRIN